MKFRVILHGSFGRHFTEIQKVAAIFEAAGIDVLAPKLTELSSETEGFALFADEVGQDPRHIELLYLQHLKELGQEGFSYFVNVDGYLGTSAAYELGIAQITNTRCFYQEKLRDHPAYVHKNAVWQPQALADYIQEHKALPTPHILRNERKIHNLWTNLMVPGSVVAAGAIIEHAPKNSQGKKEILLVKTHKWGGRYSMVGGKVRRNELLQEALLREVKEETRLSGTIGAHISTFDQIKNSGYYHAATQHIFVDNIVKVNSKKVTLNEEAQEYLWAPVDEALKYLDIEPNARHTFELYAKHLGLSV